MTEHWKHYFERSNCKVIPSFEGEGKDLLFSQLSYVHDIKQADIKNYDIALIGVADARSSASEGMAGLPDALRPWLYGLRSLSKPLKILDFGNILGRTIDDRYSAIEYVISELVKNSVLPVIIGGGQDYTIPLSGAIKKTDSSFRLSVVDGKIDWVMPDKDFSSNGFLGLLYSDKERRPFDLSVVGVQKYLYSRYQEEQMKKASFDFLRLGEIRKHGMQYAEPWLRDADVISFDFSSIRQADLPSHIFPMPNGFTADEFCQLAWYAGLSDKLKAIGFFELDVENDVNQVATMLAAQAIWHLLEGYCMRYNDFPAKELDTYAQFIVHLDDYELDIRFYNNPENDRWWVEVPGDGKNEIVACSRMDFEDASKKDIPERWFRFIKKKTV